MHTKHCILIFLLLSAFLLSVRAQQGNQFKKLKTPGYAQVNGLKMYYEIYGSGSIPRVLIHGGG